MLALHGRLLNTRSIRLKEQLTIPSNMVLIQRKNENVQFTFRVT